jgi:hypothetical protein
MAAARACSGHVRNHAHVRRARVGSSESVVNDSEASMLTTLRRSLPVLAAALVLGTASARADESKPGTPPPTKKIDNPQYAEWARYKVGAFVELTVESDSSGSKSTAKMTTKMVELTAEKLVLEVTTVSKMGEMEYAMPAQKMEVPKILEIPDVKTPEPKPEDKPKVTEGSETIDVAGKKVACKTFESTTEMMGMKSWSKTWLTKDIPGGMAKQESKTEGKAGDMVISSKSTSTVTKFGTGG